MIRLSALVLLATSCCVAWAQPSAGPRTLDDLLTQGDAEAAPVPPLIKPTKTRLPVPEPDKVRQLRTLVTQAFADDFAAARTNPEEGIFKLLGVADKTADQAKKYAVLLETERLARESRSPRRMIELVDGRTATFEDDPIRARLDALESFGVESEKMRPEFLQDLCDVALATARTAVEWEQFADAVRAADLAQRFAKAFVASAKARKQLAFIDTATDKQREAKDVAATAARSQKLHAEFERAVATAKDDPKDEQANAVIGSYYCFERADWKQGLPALARGGSSSLSLIATAELEALQTKARRPTELFAVAGKWWEYAETSEAPVAERIREHAIDIYGAVAPLLTDVIDRQLAVTRSSLKTAERNTAGTDKTKKQRLTIEFDEPDVLGLFETRGRVRITQGELELGGGRERQFSWARTKDSFTYPIRVEYEIVALPDAPFDVFPGLFCRQDDLAREGLHVHWGFDANKKTDVLVYGQRTHMKHTKLVPGFKYTVVFDVDKERVFTISVEKFKLFRMKVPAEIKLEGPVLCCGGFGHVVYRRLEIEGTRVP